MSEADLLAIEARLKAASPGPWRMGQHRQVEDRNGLSIGDIVGAHTTHERDSKNRDLVTRAPADLAALLAEARWLRSRIEDSHHYLDGLEAGRLEVLRWALRDKTPLQQFQAWQWHRRDEAASFPDALPSILFHLLESGTLHAGGWRSYPTALAAQEDLRQAIRLLARKRMEEAP